MTVGYEANFLNQTGQTNIAVGTYTNYSNVSGSNNVGVGFQNNYSVTGSGNNSFGSYAGGATSGSQNICIGEHSGNYSTAIGAGNYNIILGQYCRGAAANNSDELVIGYNKTGKGSATGFITNGSTIGAIYQGNNSSTWATVSDVRLKKNIVDNTEGLDKINAIQVRNFEYRTADEITEVDSSNVVEGATGVQLGVIAQELELVCPDCIKEESTGIKSVNTDNLFWHMLNAIKDLSAKNDALEARVAALES